MSSSDMKHSNTFDPNKKFQVEEQQINEEIYEKDIEPGVDEEDDEQFEDLPGEDDEIEDISVYQNNKTRFLSHFMWQV